MRKALWLSLPLLFMALTLSADPQAPEKKTTTAAVDLYGDPLPEGAVQRLGTMRFRHDPQTTGLVFSPDGKLLASAGNKIYCCLWDAATGRLLHRLPAASNCIDHMAFSPDSKLLITGTDLQLFDVASGKEIRRFKYPEDAITARLVAFSPDGKTIATSVELRDVGSVILFWDVATGKSLHRTIGYTHGLTALAYFPDGQQVVFATNSGDLHICDARSAKVTRELKGSQAEIQCIAVSPDSQMLVTGGWNGSVQVWNLVDGKLKHTLEFDKKRAWEEALTVAFSPESKELAAAGFGKVRFWDSASGKYLRQIDCPHQLRAAFSPDFKVLASTRNSAIELWDTNSGKPIHSSLSHTGAIYSIRFVSDAKSLYSVSYDDPVLSWSLESGKPEIVPFLAEHGSVPLLPVITFSGNGRTIAKPAWEKNAEMTFEFQSLRVLLTHPSRETRIEASDTLNQFGLSHNGMLLATQSHAEGGGNQYCFEIWHTTTGKRQCQFNLSFVPVSPFEFSHDGKFLACVDPSGIRIHDVVTGKCIRNWESKHKDTILRLLLSSDGKSLASADQSEIQIWDPGTGKLRARFDSFYQIEAAAFSPTGRILAAAGIADGFDNDGNWYGIARIQLWDMLTNQVIRKIDGPQAEVWAIAFSPDNRLLASGGGDSTILLWDMTGHAVAGQLGKYKEPPTLTAAELSALWADLAGDAPKAEKALWTLAFAPKQSMAFLKDRMHPRPAADEKEVAKLITALDSQTFAERQKAAEGLENLGETAEAAVRKHLEGKTTLEARQRLQQFLQSRDKDAIRKLRAVESVEQIGTPQARELLRLIAKESPNPRVAEAARGALARLDMRTY